MYSTDDIVERNNTYQVEKYCPDYIAVGDDGGGSAILLRIQEPSSCVYLVGHGAMTPEFMELIGESFFLAGRWLSFG